MTASDDNGSEVGPPAPRFPARLEDRVHRFRAARKRKRGYTATVVPYTGYGSTSWVRVLSRVVLTKPDTSSAPRYTKVRGWRSFTSVTVGHATVTVTVDGTEHTVTADRGGVVDEVVPVTLAPGWHIAHFTVENSEPVEAPLFISDPAATIGVISDVDDTVMVTALPRPFLAFWNTFVLDEHARAPVPGMSVLLEKLVRDHDGCPVVYLSTGAWNVAPTLNRFLSRHLFPAGPLLLTDWGPTHDRWFRSGREHKRESLRRLADEFPHLRWILIGDDGQHDEELYATFAAERPGAVAAIAIRQLSGGEAVLAGRRPHQEKPDSPPSVPWIHAPDGAGLADQLSRLELL